MNTTRTLRHAAAACTIALASLPALAANTYPVILVHGFAGFGRTELLGYKYWGGLNDLQEQLKGKYSNQLVATAVVGPFSSNWDRATELFYQIKGGCVDYGALHAAANGHLERPESFFHNGRTCYPGLYPAWDANHPVHLISHSMGGQTARMLVQLLAANGAPANPSLFPYAVNASWVKSVTTIATPNDGTTLAYRIVDWVPFVQQLVTGIAGASGATGGNAIYDFKFDQWGVGPRTASESFGDYVNRVTSLPLWNSGIKDLSPYDLSPAGAMAENDWVKDQPDVTYFSWVTNSSFTGVLTGWSYPDVDTNVLIGAFAGPGFMGNYYRDSRPMPPVTDSSWFPSDAVVNSIAQKAPTWAMNSSGAIYKRPVVVRDISNGGTPQAGAWNYRGQLGGFDHLDAVGWTLFWDSLSWYKARVDELRAL
ncbi:MAG: lipase [Pseudomonadota bacterium]|nr:lipase [Pseudomonadota bacterium]